MRPLHIIHVFIEYLSYIQKQIMNIVMIPMDRMDYNYISHLKIVSINTLIHS